MWGHVNPDRNPVLLRTSTLASGHMEVRIWVRVMASVRVGLRFAVRVRG